MLSKALTASQPGGEQKKIRFWVWFLNLFYYVWEHFEYKNFGHNFVHLVIIEKIMLLGWNLNESP